MTAEEKFEEFWHTGEYEYKTVVDEDVSRAAYLSGYRAGLERAISVVDAYDKGRDNENSYEFDLMTDDIAARLREEAKGE